MDQLSEVLADVHANAVVTGHFTLHAPWAFDKPAVQGIPFRICRGAPCWLHVDDEPPVLMREGDVVLLPHGSPHRLSSAPEVPPVPFDTLLAERGIVPRSDTPLELDVAGAGPACELHTAIVGFPSGHRHPLFAILPAVIHIRHDDPAVAPWLKSTLQTFIEESMACQPGWMIAAARLSDVLCVQIVRAYLLQSEGVGPHWLKGLLDRQIGRAVLAVHRAPGDDWDVAALSARAGMSRSRFVARFTTLVGRPPMAHVTDVRMHLAAAKLATRTLRGRGGRCGGLCVRESVFTRVQALGRRGAARLWTAHPRPARRARSLTPPLRISHTLRAIRQLAGFACKACGAALHSMRSAPGARRRDTFPNSPAFEQSRLAGPTGHRS